MEGRHRTAYALKKLRCRPFPQSNDSGVSADSTRQIEIFRAASLAVDAGLDTLDCICSAIHARHRFGWIGGTASDMPAQRLQRRRE